MPAQECDESQVARSSVSITTIRPIERSGPVTLFTKNLNTSKIKISQPRKFLIEIFIFFSKILFTLTSKVKIKIRFFVIFYSIDTSYF